MVCVGLGGRRIGVIVVKGESGYYVGAGVGGVPPEWEG
jgi:hypothetical protein